MAKSPRLPAEVRRLLETAGYVWDADEADWSHPKTKRVLKAELAVRMTRDQLVDWIREGEGRRR
jgi:hypothetical protein